MDCGSKCIQQLTVKDDTTILHMGANREQCKTGSAHNLFDTIVKQWKEHYISEKTTETPTKKICID